MNLDNYITPHGNQLVIRAPDQLLDNSQLYCKVQTSDGKLAGQDSVKVRVRQPSRTDSGEPQLPPLSVQVVPKHVDVAIDEEIELECKLDPDTVESSIADRIKVGAAFVSIPFDSNQTV